MSETVDLAFIGRRLDSVQNDVADVRRRMLGLVDRFDGVEGSLEQLRTGVVRLEARMSLLEVRIDAVVERQSRQEALLHRALLLIERIAQAQGIAE